ncbi:MAG TPA: magnesium/cobalt transporter CorA [Coriobacteriia bacterium]
MPARITVRWIEGGDLRSGGLEGLKAARAQGPVWVDLTDPDEESLATLGELFPLHPLALEDCLHFPQRPKLDAYPEFLFLVWITPRLKPDDGIEYGEIDIFLGERFLITSHAGEALILDDVATSSEPILQGGIQWTLHAVLDRAVDDVFPAVDYISDQLDTIEDELLEKAAREQLQRLYAMKRLLVALHKVIGPERDVLREMARHEAFISQDAYLYFQDIGDHLARVADSVDTYRDVASGAMDIYLSAVNNRMNEIMKQLTVVATIFMPLTLISGIYGMNVTAGMWPPITAVWSFGVVITSMVVISVSMLWIFKRRNWW